MAAAGDWLVCPRVATALERLEPELRRVLAFSDAFARELAWLLAGRSGKRLRPALLLVAGAFGSREDHEPLLRAAAALELIHVASLYHDDVMDRAATRRSGPSANALWGNLAAVSGGTILYARAIELLASLGDAANQLVSAAAVDLCTGQLLEVENAYNLDLDERQHLDILARKTAVLFELPCRLGAQLAGLPAEMLEHLGRFGRDLGIAFQVTDDVLDLAGDAAVVGKGTRTDLREGVYSLPIILALGGSPRTSTALRGSLSKMRLSGAELDHAVSSVVESGAVEEARMRARCFAASACGHLAELPTGAPRDSLLRLAQFCVERSR